MNSANVDSILALRGPIIIFGAGGFIGARLAETLLKHRNDILAVTHQNDIPWRLSKVGIKNLVKCDQTNRAEVYHIFAHKKPRTVFAFAAYGAYARQVDFDQIYQTNFLGVLNLLSASKEFGVDAFVHAGSSSEYGTNSDGPSEDALTRPNSDYSVSKVAASQLISFFANHNNVPAVNLRFYSIYGPFEEGDRLIPKLIEYGRNKKYPPLVNPNICRDFVYVDDAINAAILSARPMQPNIYGQSLNIASGRQTTLQQLVELSRTHFQIQTEPVWGSMPNRGWDLTKWNGNPKKAADLIGWSPTTDLETGFALTSEWFLQLLDPSKSAGTEIQGTPMFDRITAVIACYKDGQAVPIMYERLVASFAAIGCDYEIIFVNDCSPDNSAEVISAICAKDYRVTMIEHSRNFGSQSAFISGMEIATGNAVVLLDGDLQDPPELIPEFFAQWKQGFDVVYGRRTAREATFFLQLAYKGFYRLLRFMAEIPIPVDAGDFSLMDRRVVKEILAMPERDQFLRGLRAWVGFRQIGIPYTRPERMFGVTTNNLRKNFWWARKAIFSFSYAPLEWLVFGSMTFMIIAISAIVVQIIYRIMFPDIPHGIPTIIILVLFFGALNMSAFAILGEYIGKILQESKGRPRFVRSRLVIAGREIDPQVGPR